MKKPERHYRTRPIEKELRALLQSEHPPKKAEISPEAIQSFIRGLPERRYVVGGPPPVPDENGCTLKFMWDSKSIGLDVNYDLRPRAMLLHY